MGIQHEWYTYLTLGLSLCGKEGTVGCRLRRTGNRQPRSDGDAMLDQASVT